MKNFDDLDFEIHPMQKSYDPFASVLAGMFSPTGGSTFDAQARLFFDNGYGVSVVTGTAAYDNYEIAVLKGDENKSNICYDTPITDDVIPCSTEEDVSKIMKQVQEL